MLYDIAGLLVACEACGERFARQAPPYESSRSGEPDITVRVDDDDLRRALARGILGEDDCRYMLSGMRFYFELLKYGGLMLHSSAVAVDGMAYLFSGPSGVGKSTHTGNWLKLLGDRAYILNDDKPALRLTDGGFCACGTPWSGKNDLSRNEMLPLAGICFIARGETNRIERVSGAEAAGLLLGQTTHNIRAERMNILLELLDKLIADVPVYRLYCTADIASAEVSYKAMRRVKDED